MIKKILNLTVLSVLVVGFTSCNDDDDNNVATLSNQEKAIALIKGFETGDQTALDYVSDETYIQHNANFPDGKEVLVNFFSGGPSGTTVTNHRAFTDGNYVVLHSTYGGTWNNGTPQVAFDVFRFENGLIVEHWDNLQDVSDPQVDAVNGNTQVDGPTTVTDTSLTTSNKEVISNFAQNVLVGGSWVTQAPTYFDGLGQYFQHSVGMPNGIDWFASFGDNFQFYDSESPRFIHGEGNFVLIMSQGSQAAGVESTAYFDLFRLQNGYIIEHWDTQQTIPPASEWVNSNGKW
ncbi:hypothetical protein UJ101_01331 [Flavobacteriaceae bacterium UJ101]|nr:hypothetical protein UJ101_01331 [Flavobacteriaceae bacterium UJ101]